MYQRGETNQKGMQEGARGLLAGVGVAKTKYNQIAVLGDVNLSNL